MSDESEVVVENLDSSESSGASNESTAQDSSVSSGESGSEGPASAENEAIEAAASAGEAERVALEASSEESGDNADSAASSFKPDFKLKVLDKEYEVPEQFRSLMRDEKTSKEVREIFEKAHAMDFHKVRHEDAVKTKNQLNTEINGMKGYVQGLGNIYRSAVDPVNGNINRLDRFFKELNVPEQVLFNYVAEKIKLQQMSPEAQAQVRNNLQSEERAEQLSRERDSLSGEQMQTKRQIKEILLNQGLNQPDITKFAQSYEQMVGQPGAFKKAVVEHARFRWFESKEDLSPEQAIQEVIAKYPALRNVDATNQVVSQNQQTVNGKVAIQRTERTIPNVQGRGTSPVKSKPKSIQDLKDIHARMT